MMATQSRRGTGSGEALTQRRLAVLEKDERTATRDSGT